MTGRGFAKFDAAVKTVEAALKDNETRKKIRTLMPTLIGKIVFYTEAGGQDGGAFEVFDRQGKRIYTSLSMQ